MPIEYDEDYVQSRSSEYERDVHSQLEKLDRIRKQNAERQRRWRLRQKGIVKTCPHCGGKL